MLKSITYLSLTFFTTAVFAIETSSAAAKQSKNSAPILRVHIKGLKDEMLQKNVQAFLAIYEENGKVIKNPSYIDYLAKSGSEQIQQALQPFGYYLAEVKMVNNKQKNSWTVSYQIQKGQPVLAQSIDININGEGKKQKAYRTLLSNFPLKKGDILVQNKYETFKNDILALATTYGYFDGHFETKAIVISDDYQSADIQLNYETGQRYQFGETNIKQNFLDQDVFERFLSYREGEVYSSKVLADVQRDLYNSNYVKIIDITANPDKTTKSVPVEFTLTPKANKKHTFSIGYGTDTGARAKHLFHWRWVNRRGHQLKTNTYLAEKIQEVGLEYRIPAQKPATDYYKIFAAGKRNHNGDIESTMWNFGGAYHDQVKNWEREFGIKNQQEDFSLGNDKGDITLLTPYTTFTYRKVDDPLNISRGLWLQGSLSGAHTSLASDVTFLQAVAGAKVVRTFADKHKVKLSASIGKTWVDNFHQLPAAYRFFTGGDRTIRGYRFNDIGDRDSSNSNIGGNKMYFASAEYEYFFKDKMALATFIDAGDAYSADQSSIKLGAGVGFHYYSPIGPIRIDLAHGFDEPGDDVRLHLNIGPEL